MTPRRRRRAKNITDRRKRKCGPAVWLKLGAGKLFADKIDGKSIFMCCLDKL
jgi:hypothetical protein